MNRPKTAPVLLFVAAFCAVLIGRLPLRWVAPHLPSDLHCEQPEGSLWAGRCASLSVKRATGAFMLLGDVRWALRPAPLLRARLALDLSLLRGPATARGLVQLGVGHFEVRDLTAQGPLDPGLVPGFPPNWSGSIRITDARLRLDKGQLTALEGTAVASDLVAAGVKRTAYGSYQLKIPRVTDGGLAPGALTDLGGPLEVHGVFRITPKREWTLEGRVAPRPTADPDLVQQIQYLGGADAQGQRQFSVAGTL